MEEEENPIEELSDNWEFVNKLNDKVELFYFLKRLPPKEKKIIKLKMAGYNLDEIALKMGLSERTIRRKMSVFASQISIIK